MGEPWTDWDAMDLKTLTEVCVVLDAVQKARGLSPLWNYGHDFDPWRRYIVTLDWQLALQLDTRRK